MTDDTTNTEQVRPVLREGYCCDCKNTPIEYIIDVAKIPGHPCNGCWFHGDKRNWEPKYEGAYYADALTLAKEEEDRK